MSFFGDRKLHQMFAILANLICSYIGGFEFEMETKEIEHLCLFGIFLDPNGGKVSRCVCSGSLCIR